MPIVPLSTNLRGTVCDAYYHALLQVMVPSVQHVAAINTIGAYLLCYLTGDNYNVVAGSVYVRQGGGMLAWRADPSRMDEHEYYVWIEHRDAAGRTELIDFASRYWQDWARGQSALWIGPAPETIWAFRDELDSMIATYAPDGEITNIVRIALHNAFRSPTPPAAIAAWESAINSAVERFAQDPRGLEHLMKAGIAEPEIRTTN